MSLDIQVSEVLDLARDKTGCNCDRTMYSFDYLLDKIFGEFGKRDGYYLEVRETVKNILYRRKNERLREV